MKVEYEEELKKLCWKVIQGCMNITKTEPTAYDIEKVVAELKEWTFNADINLGDGTVKNTHSPVQPFLAQFKVMPYLEYLNWFMPVGAILTVCEVWLACIAIFYLYSIILRWVKAIGD